MSISRSRRGIRLQKSNSSSIKETDYFCRIVMTQGKDYTEASDWNSELTETVA